MFEDAVKEELAKAPALTPSQISRIRTILKESPYKPVDESKAA